MRVMIERVFAGRFAGARCHAEHRGGEDADDHDCDQQLDEGDAGARAASVRAGSPRLCRGFCPGFFGRFFGNDG
jgi:hypothetical protein